MRTALRTTAWRRTLTVTLAVALSGALAVPAATAAQSSAPHKRSGHVATATVSGAKAVGTSTGVAVVGPAVKYVRKADGTVRRVR